MEMKHQELLDTVIGSLKDIAKTDTIFGQPFNIGEWSCIPVMKVAAGFGSGGGVGEDKKTAQGSGGGAGAGLSIAPVAIIATRGDEIKMMNIGKTDFKSIDNLIDRTPELIEKIGNILNKDKKSND